MNQRFLQKLGPWGKRFDAFLAKAFTDIESKLYGRVNNFLVLVIFLSIVIMIFESVESIHTKYLKTFNIIESVIVVIFTIEYIINIYLAKIEYKRRSKYIFSFWGFIDILAILPSYLGLINLSALKAIRVFRILRFLRMLRVLKLAKHAAEKVTKTRGQKVNTLKFDLQIYFFTLISVVIVFGTLAYFAESGSNEGFSSIPASMWWTFVTITTVGYGDITPITLAGKLIAIPTMLSGLVLFGMLMNVIGKAMMELLFGTVHDLEHHHDLHYHDAEWYKTHEEVVLYLDTHNKDQMEKFKNFLEEIK